VLTLNPQGFEVRAEEGCRRPHVQHAGNADADAPPLLPGLVRAALERAFHLHPARAEQGLPELHVFLGRVRRGHWQSIIEMAEQLLGFGVGQVGKPLAEGLALRR